MTTHYYPNSLVNRVTEVVRHKGKATLTEVSEEFPDHDKKQIHDALSNARNRKLIKVIFRGNFNGRTESVWAVEVEKPSPMSMEKKRPVASVWQLGTPVIKEWPPAFEGGRAFRPLGPWIDPEELASNDTRKAA
jgi:hypothetical protein